jgi:alkanesulfonate monooxygenase SsuD/methylene tetrahydromethanopterin reductase-like flavin-dependent oxidoreductase (luciferase family)
MADDFEPLNVDSLLDQLKQTPQDFNVPKDSAPITTLPPVSTVPPTEEELGDYIIKKTSELIDQTMNAFKNIRDIAVQSNDAETVEALASLVKSTTGALDSLNKIHVQNKKTKAAKEIAHINAYARKKAADTLAGGNNNVMVGSREEVLKMIAEAVHKSKIAGGPVLDGELVEDTKQGAIVATLNEPDNVPGSKP